MVEEDYVDLRPSQSSLGTTASLQRLSTHYTWIVMVRTETRDECKQSLFHWLQKFYISVSIRSCLHYTGKKYLEGFFFLSAGVGGGNIFTSIYIFPAMHNQTIISYRNSLTAFKRINLGLK